MCCRRAFTSPISRVSSLNPFSSALSSAGWRRWPLYQNLLAARGPLAPLASFVTQGEELGFHVVLARRVSGAARTLMSDPMVGRLREFGADGLILSGDPREGVLLGDQRAAQRIPGRGLLIRRRQEPTLIHAVVDDETEPVTYDARPAGAGREVQP